MPAIPTPFQPDKFFTAQQHQRLSELIEHLREARDFNRELAPGEWRELESLIEAELEATIKRVESMLGE